MKREDIEIMAPVGSYESLMAAIQGEADAVYFGVGQLNMRARSSSNFGLDDLVKISSICKENNIKSYLTLNTVIYDAEITLMHSIVDAAVSNNISAIIASDIAVIKYARSVGMEVHISTQSNISNIEALRYYAQYADVVVLARELSLQQIKSITSAVKEQNICGPSGKPIGIEMFVHGALCMAISGKCYLSLDNMNFSANRGACLQLCRRPYKVTDTDGGIELEVDNKYIMSPKDLCTIGFIDKMIQAGVSVLKIEGRGRPAEYVKTVCSCYNEAIDAIIDDSYSEEKIEGWTKRLRKVFNRGFWEGYYMGKTTGEWSERYGSHATRKKEYISKCSNFFSKLMVAEFKIESGSLAVGDEILITGPTTGVIETTVKEIRVNYEKTEIANKGDVCSVPVTTTIRRSDKLYKLTISDIE